MVSIGIGGSHPRPLMATEALRPCAIHDLRIRCVANVDENHSINTLDPQTLGSLIALYEHKIFVQGLSGT